MLALPPRLDVGISVGEQPLSLLGAVFLLNNCPVAVWHPSVLASDWPRGRFVFWGCVERALRHRTAIVLDGIIGFLRVVRFHEGTASGCRYRVRSTSYLRRTFTTCPDDPSGRAQRADLSHKYPTADRLIKTAAAACQAVLLLVSLNCAFLAQMRRLNAAVRVSHGCPADAICEKHVMRSAAEQLRSARQGHTTGHYHRSTSAPEAAKPGIAAAGAGTAGCLHSLGLQPFSPEAPWPPNLHAESRMRQSRSKLLALSWSQQPNAGASRAARYLLTDLLVLCEDGRETGSCTLACAPDVSIDARMLSFFLLIPGHQW